MTDASIGYGLTYGIEATAGGGTYVALAEVFDCTPPNVTVDQVEATHYGSAGRSREYIPALNDNGEASLSMNYVPGSVSDLRILALKTAGTVLAHKITFPNGVYITYQAFVIGYETAIPLDDRMTANVTVKITGAVTQVDPA